MGGLLGDVFLHLLPEAWGSQERQVRISLGLWVTVGLLSFMLVEKIVKLTEEATSSSVESDDCGGERERKEEEKEMFHAQGTQTKDQLSNGSAKTMPHVNGYSQSANGDHFPPKNGLKHRNGYTGVNGFNRAHCNTSEGNNGVIMRSLSHGPAGGPHSESRHYQAIRGDESCRVRGACQHENIAPQTKQTESSKSKWLQKDISGYLNLVANCTDNFTHGLAIATSYVANPAVGLLTTLAILCHEIPHEIGDFAILLNSGFNLKEAAKAQMCTACGGLVGVVAGLTAEHLSNASEWLLPFTAGGFLYIALISIIPDLLENCAKTSFKQTVWEIVAVVMGIVIMALVTIVEKKSCGHMPLHLKH